VPPREADPAAVATSTVGTSPRPRTARRWTTRVRCCCVTYTPAPCCRGVGDTSVIPRSVCIPTYSTVFFPLPDVPHPGAAASTVCKQAGRHPATGPPRPMRCCAWQEDWSLLHPYPTQRRGLDATVPSRMERSHWFREGSHLAGRSGSSLATTHPLCFDRCGEPHPPLFQHARNAGALRLPLRASTVRWR